MQDHCFIRKHFAARMVAKYKYIHVYLYESLSLCVRACARARASTNSTPLNLQNSFSGQEI
jgi:hypothetical protein